LGTQEAEFQDLPLNSATVVMCFVPSADIADLQACLHAPHRQASQRE